jgi:c-di-GMP-binding flagellar brake protein YcgR
MAAKNRTVLTKEAELQGFTKVTDPLELHRVLKRAIETTAKVDVRLPEQKIQFQAVILESSDIESGFQIEAPADISDEAIQAAPAKALVNANLIAFMRGQNLLCVHSQNVEWKERTLIVAPPWSIFKLQRRKEPRYQIPAAYDLFVSMESVEGTRRRIQKRVLDISEHGMGFQVASMREAAPYRKGMFLRKMEVTIENRQIFFDARVANILRITDDPRRAGVKVGIELIRISPLDKQFIAAYVARNLVQIYT